MKTVISKDGTKIAYDKTGNGPALILIGGATNTRVMSTELAALLSDSFTVYNYDRRGRGDSTDTQPYSVQKEIEDIDALIQEAGGTAYIYSISSGGALALEAASNLVHKVTKLAIYEVPYDESEDGIKKWRSYTSELQNLINQDKRSETVELFMKFVGVPDEMLVNFKQLPMWHGLEKISPTIMYDAACLGEERLIPIEKAKRITADTLIMDGGASLSVMPFMNTTAKKLVQVIPNATHETLEGQTHLVDSKILVTVLKKFFMYS